MIVKTKKVRNVQRNMDQPDWKRVCVTEFGRSLTLTCSALPFTLFLSVLDLLYSDFHLGKL